MVARPAKHTVFSPAARPHVLVAADGSIAAIQEPARIAIVELPSCTAFAELGIDAAQEADIAWVGTPPRLLVLARHANHSVVHLVDPFGPRTIAELRLEAPMKLSAAVGSHALVIGPLGASILSVGDKGVALNPFPARARPVTAGAAGTAFVVALGSAIEEWDPQTRMPKRRLKLPRPAVIEHVGGSDRVVWMIPREDRTRIEVIPLVHRGQPKAHELPEPIASIASHPRSDLVACLGEKSGRIYVVDLDGRAGLRMIGPEGIERAETVALVIGRATGVLAAQRDRKLNVVTIERDRDAPADVPTDIHAPPVPPLKHDDTLPSPKSSLTDDDEPVVTKPEYVSMLSKAEPVAKPDDSLGAAKPDHTMVESTPAKSTIRRPQWPSVVTPPPLKVDTDPMGDARLLEAWRERVRNPRAATAQPVRGLWDDATPHWREEAVAWARAYLAAINSEPTTTAIIRAIGDAPASTPFGAIVARHELSPQLQPAIALLYGAYLAGIDGVAPADIAQLLGGRWDEALGRGELFSRGVVGEAFASRIRLMPAIMRALDELPPTTGTLIGTPGPVSLLGPCVLVAAGPLPIVAEACLSSVGGAILAYDSDRDPGELIAEARAYGAAPMWRVQPFALDIIPTDQPIILVVDDDETADSLGIPRLT